LENPSRTFPLASNSPSGRQFARFAPVYFVMGDFWRLSPCARQYHGIHADGVASSAGIFRKSENCLLESLFGTVYLPGVRDFMGSRFPNHNGDTVA